MSSSRAGLVPSRIPVRSMITVAYLPPRLVWRRAPHVRTPGTPVTTDRDRQRGGRQPGGSRASCRITVSRARPSQPQRRRHWPGSRTRHASTAGPGSRRWPVTSSPSSSRRQNVVRSAREPSSGARRDGSVGHVEVFQMSVQAPSSSGELDPYPVTDAPSTSTGTTPSIVKSPITHPAPGPAQRPDASPAARCPSGPGCRACATTAAPGSLKW